MPVVRPTLRDVKSRTAGLTHVGHRPPQRHDTTPRPVSGLASGVTITPGRDAFPCRTTDTVAHRRACTRLPLRGQRRHTPAQLGGGTDFPFNPTVRAVEPAGHLRSKTRQATWALRGRQIGMAGPRLRHRCVGIDRAPWCCEDSGRITIIIRTPGASVARCPDHQVQPTAWSRPHHERSTADDPPNTLGPAPLGDDLGTALGIGLSRSPGDGLSHQRLPHRQLGRGA